MSRFILFILITILILLFSNIYVCRKYEELIKNIKLKIPAGIIRIGFLTAAIVLLASIFLQKWLNNHAIINTIFVYTATIYLGMLVYSLLSFLAGDAFLIIVRIARVYPNYKEFSRKFVALWVIIPFLAAAVTAYGLYNTRNFVVTEYVISINKKSNLDSLNIVMLSDLHVGTSINKNELLVIKDKINAIEPDVLVICGDLFDHSSHPEMMAYAVATLGSIRTQYGIFFITGNHEYYLGDIKQTLSYFNSSKIKVLRDETVLLSDICLIGRNDASYKNRTALSELILSADIRRPIMLLDHQPNEIYEAEKLGVDLQLSGHTHNGQIFPFNYIAAFVNSAHYGLNSIGKYNAVISSGCGTWKFPIRTGSPSEIVHVKLNFTAY